MLDGSDDYDFNPTNSSKLASLFGNLSANTESNSSLIYKAPKPNGAADKKTNTDSNVPKSSVVIGKIISLWKLENNDYVALGKHGLAIIGSSDQNVYEMISYKEKTNIIFRLRLTSSFVYHIQKDSFSSFYDGNSQNWLVKFEGQDQEEFTKILKDYDVKIMNASNNCSEKTAQFEKPELPQKPMLNTADKDESQSDSSESKQRANILNRMAKMGQAILPKHEIKNTSTELSDSDFEEKVQKRIPPRQIKRAGAERLPKQTVISSSESQVISDNKVLNDKYQSEPRDINNPQFIANQSYNTQIIPSQVLNNPQQFQNNLYSSQMMPNQIYHPGWSNDGYNQFIIAQNTELKMNLAQISAKLDSVLNNKKTDDEEVDKKILISRLKTMRLRIENLEMALQKSEESSSLFRTKNEELERKLQNSTGVESKNKEIEILEKTISDLKFTLQESQAKASETLFQIEQLKSQLKEHEDTIEQQKLELNENNKLKCTIEDTEELNKTIKTLNDTIDNLKLKQKDFEEYYQKSESEKKLLSQAINSKIQTFDEFVKTQMNDMYQSILDDFKEEQSYSFSDIKMSVAKNLKMTSFKVIEKCVDIFKENKFLEE